MSSSQVIQYLQSQPISVLRLEAQGNISFLQTCKQELCQRISSAPSLQLDDSTTFSDRQPLTVYKALYLLRPCVPELCDETVFQCFSQCLLLTRKSCFFAIILRDEVLLFIHNQSCSISSILQETLQSLLHNDLEDPNRFCWLALSSLIVCFAEDVKSTFEELQQRNMELRVNSISDYIYYKDIVLQRERLQQLTMDVKDFQQILLGIISLQISKSAEDKVGHLFPMISRIHSILRVS